jgi:hypothetical protein
VLLLAAIAAIRFDMLKIQQNALVALQRYLHNHVAATAGRFDTLKDPAKCIGSSAKIFAQQQWEQVYKSKCKSRRKGT